MYMHIYIDSAHVHIHVIVIIMLRSMCSCVHYDLHNNNYACYKLGNVVTIHSNIHWILEYIVM